MAKLFDRVILEGVTLADLSQLLSYIEDRERHMWYYGNKEQFETRHKKLKQLIKSIVDYAYSDSVKLPKVIKNE